MGRDSLVLVKLRAAGFSPMPEEGDGAVIVMQRAKPAAPVGRDRSARASVDAAELAARLSRERVS